MISQKLVFRGTGNVNFNDGVPNCAVIIEIIVMLNIEHFYLNFTKHKSSD